MRVVYERIARAPREGDGIVERFCGFYSEAVGIHGDGSETGIMGYGRIVVARTAYTTPEESNIDAAPSASKWQKRETPERLARAFTHYLLLSILTTLTRFPSTSSTARYTPDAASCEVPL